MCGDTAFIVGFIALMQTELFGYPGGISSLTASWTPPGHVAAGWAAGPRALALLREAAGILGGALRW